jgi:hypothetical protein
MGTGSSFFRVKQQVCEGDYSPLSSDKDKNVYNYTFTPLYIFMARCSIKQRENVTFNLTSNHSTANLFTTEKKREREK